MFMSIKEDQSQEEMKYVSLFELFTLAWHEFTFIFIKVSRNEKEFCVCKQPKIM